jgi:hypothetical protein
MKQVITFPINVFGHDIECDSAPGKAKDLSDHSFEVQQHFIVRKSAFFSENSVHHDIIEQGQFSVVLKNVTAEVLYCGEFASRHLYETR